MLGVDGFPDISACRHDSALGRAELLQCSIQYPGSPFALAIQKSSQCLRQAFVLGQQCGMHDYCNYCAQPRDLHISAAQHPTHNRSPFAPYARSWDLDARSAVRHDSVAMLEQVGLTGTVTTKLGSKRRFSGAPLRWG